MDATRVRALLANENGFAMVTVIGVMVVSMAFASAAAIASINSLRGTVRDEDSKMALGAADAGAATALAHQNSIAQSGNPCLASDAGGTLVSTSIGADGWCPPVTGSIDGGTYSYQVGPQPDGTIRVVSVGASDGVSRRIELTASDSAGSNVFADASVLAQSGITMDSNAEVHADTATNGSIALSSNAQLCGAASVGVGETLSLGTNSRHGGGDCDQSSYPLNSEPLSLAGVQPGDLTNNSNDLIPIPGAEPSVEGDQIQGKETDVIWDPATRRLELRKNVALVLGGAEPYSFCQVKLGSNTELVIADGASVRMFFDAPEDCEGEQVPLQMDSNSKITATGGGATQVAMLFVGSTSPDPRDEILLASNAQPNADCSSEFVIYAPRTDIKFNSNVTYCGAIAGETIHLDSNSVLRSSSETTHFELPGAGPHYLADRFVECTATTPETTGAGC